DTQLSFFPVNDDKNDPVADNTTTVTEHKRKKKRTHDDWMSELPVEEVLHKEDDPKCDKYDELIYTPAKFHIRRHIVKVYKCIKCGTAPEVSTEPCNIRRAEHPELMIPGSYCSPELLAHIIYEKFCKTVPLHRQEKDFKSKGIHLLKATMSNWVCYAAEKWCNPIVQNMKEKLLSEKIIHADETVFQVLHEKRQKSNDRFKNVGIL
ncbi:transposase, partial [uncultured Ruminococcus sp.]|uniref:IS66 family transposase n=1 Tax=uncultured Ruminococcus sp. TaxID=165186 RepID=UPI0025F8BC86